MKWRNVEPPYITRWSAERDLNTRVVERYGRIAYEVEKPGDRDEHGILWCQTESRQGLGRPEFKKVHPQRQREVMGRLLCQVCAGPADQNTDGVLWLLTQVHDDDWTDWPEKCAADEPPICRVCASRAIRQCPALRQHGAIVVRAYECPVVGVRGALYEPSWPFPRLAGQILARFSYPGIGWVRASALVRELRGCAILPVEEVERVGA